MIGYFPKFLEKVRKVDFLIPLIFAIPIAYHFFINRKIWHCTKFSQSICPYEAIQISVICLIIAGILSYFRWKWVYVMDEKSQRIFKKNLINSKNKTQSISGRVVVAGILMVLLILFTIILSLSHQEYVKSLILIGVEAFFATVLLFEIRGRKNTKQTLILLGFIVIYFLTLFIIFYK